MKVNRFPFAIALVIALCAVVPTASRAADAPAAAFRSQPVDGEVLKVDKAHGTVTLRHGPLTNLDVPAMTMVLKARDPGMLETLRAGDKVRFTVDRVDDGPVLTTIAPATK